MIHAVAIQMNEFPPEYAYHVLRSAYALYDRSPGDLDRNELDAVQRQARNTLRIESRVLETPEAAAVRLPAQQLDAALAQIAARYADGNAFHKDMYANGLDEAALRTAVHRELIFDAVMRGVGEHGAAVSDIDVQLFYQLHKERFVTPERRTARHILITVNSDYADNTAEAARRRLSEIERRLRRHPKRFAGEAVRHSECPTAMQGGLLGQVTRNTLYHELETALFNLNEGQVSPIVETTLGLHLVLCERIHPADSVPLAHAAGRIRRMLEERQRKACQKAWLKALGGAGE